MHILRNLSQDTCQQYHAMLFASIKKDISAVMSDVTQKVEFFAALQDLGELDGVCTFCEMAVPLVSRIAESLGLSGNSPDAVDAARDKHSTRAKMAAAGLPTPRNMLVQQPSDLKPAADMVKFPAGEPNHFCRSEQNTQQEDSLGRL